MATTATTRSMDEIVDGLKDHVWILLRAQRVDAAMVLLAAEVGAWLEAQKEPKRVPEPEPEAEPEEVALDGVVLATGAELEVLTGRELVLLSR